MRNISLFCLWRVALYVKAMLNSIAFYKGTFLHVTPVRIIVPCMFKSCRGGGWVSNASLKSSSRSSLAPIEMFYSNIFHITNNLKIYHPAHIYIIISLSDFPQPEFLLKLLEILYCKLQKQCKLTFEVVAVVNAAITLFPVVTACDRSFQIFTVDANFW